MNPILVKELRQSLRSHWFEIIFLWLIASLCVITGIGLHYSTPTWITLLFWLDVGITLHLLLPLHSALSASDDRQRGNFELIRVTGLTADKIVRHRLVALFFHGVIIATLVLPFVLLRYFLGGIELIDEFQYLVLMTLSLPVMGAAILSLVAANGIARFFLTLIAMLLIPAYELQTVATAFRPGNESFVFVVVWSITSLIGYKVGLALASESFLLSHRRA
jgi:hypothetical protein